jgi:hypothetical protein
MTKAQMNRHPMKLDVVERLPTVRSDPEESIVRIQDSDDESTPPSPAPTDSDEDVVIQSDREDGPLDDDAADTSTDEDDAEDEVVLENDDFDFDAARHHREIALAYYEKRNVVGEGVAKAMTSHTHNEGEDEWDQPVCIPDFALLCERSPHHHFIGSASGCYAIISETQTLHVSLYG